MSTETNNANVNKVVYGTNVLVDLTGDTVESSVLLAGYTAHDASGARISGGIEIATLAEAKAYLGIQ